MGSRPDDGLPVSGRSGMIAGSMLGLGRALGETIAVLIILRHRSRLGHWSLFDGGYTFASKIASAAAEFSDQLPDRRLHRGRLRAVRPDIRRQRACPAGRRRKGERRMTKPTLDAAGQGADLPPDQPQPQVKNNVADGLVRRCRSLIAMVPLVWVLYTVIESRVSGAIISRTWWINSLAGMLPEQFGRRRLPRDLRHARPGWYRGGLAVPLGVLVGHLPGRVRRRDRLAQADHLHGRHPRRRAVDRGRAVHLRAVDRHVGLPAERASRCRWRWCC